MRSLMLPLLALMIAPACTFGPRLARFAPARSPEGVRAVVITTTQASLTGELLDVRAEDLLLLADGRVISVRFDRIDRASFPGLNVFLNWDDAVSEASRERLRMASRFPQHLSAELLHSLLGSCGQSEPDAAP